LIAAAGVAVFTYDSFSSVDALDFRSSFLNGVLRSSRAFFTITWCVADYKYSVRNLQADSDQYAAALSEIHLRLAGRILKLCDANRGFYVKAGQFVSSMRQVPKEYSSTLSYLQDQALPYDFKTISGVVARSLGKDTTEIFFSFDEQPIAAASIAQVHRALLKNNQEVAVKVQYPGLENQMKFDLATMGFFSNIISWLIPEYNLEWMVSEFTKSITSELDFIQEAKNSERAAHNFRKNKMVTIPRIYWDATSSQVLTMQFCEGQKIDDIGYLRQKGISPFEVAKALVDMFSEMIFVHGFLHGDPHPGNILVSPQGPDAFSLVLLDHGIYRELSEEFRMNYCRLWEALILLDSQKIQRLGETFGVGKYAQFLPVIFTGRTIDSKSVLGGGRTPEEQKRLKEEMKSVNLEDVFSFMGSLSPDFLAVLRSHGMLRSLVSKLGAPKRIQLLGYSEYAVRGLYAANPRAESGSAIAVTMSRVKAGIKYFKLMILLG
ncbi:hypothetical protein M569_01373, partial [Genlisea aurea]